MQPLQSDAIKAVFDCAARQDANVYLVGGYLRDCLLGRDKPGKDFDFAVSGASGFALAQTLAERLNGHFVPLDETTDTARVVLKDGVILDLAGCVGGDIASDVWRRDFSINALFWTPSTPAKINDLVGGVNDIEKRSVRALSATVLQEDPLRLLRAFRFAATLDFAIHAQTLAWIATHHALIECVAVERINAELFAILGVSDCAAVLHQMAQTGLLEHIFSELSATRVVPQNAYHHLNLFNHSLETVLKLEQTLAETPDWPAVKLDEEISYGVTRLAATKVAALLHDIGKPKTWAVTPEGKHTFIGHDGLGADMVTDLATRLRWARPVERFVAKLVKWHLRPGQLFHQSEPPTTKAVLRFYRNASPEVPELLLLALGDLGATQGPAMVGEKEKDLRRNLIELLGGYSVFLEDSQRQPKLMNGNDIMQLLGIEAGPNIGVLLSALEEAQEFKEVTNRTQAELFVRKLYTKDFLQ